MSNDVDARAAAYEWSILDRFGEDYFNGVRWGGAASGVFLFDQCRRVFRYTRKQHFLVDTVHLGLDEDFVRGRATITRTIKRSLSTEKKFLLCMIGLTAAGSHNILACLLANLRVKEFQRRSAALTQQDDARQPYGQQRPTFWDGFAVGCIGSVMDADLPQQPAHKYLGMRCGW